MKLDRKTEDFVKEETIDESTQVTKKSANKPKKYIITVTNLAIREDADPESDKIGIAEAGHTLIDEIKNNYGHLADGSGWVKMDYLRKAD